MPAPKSPVHGIIQDVRVIILPIHFVVVDGLPACRHVTLLPWRVLCKLLILEDTAVVVIQAGSAIEIEDANQIASKFSQKVQDIGMPCRHASRVRKKMTKYPPARRWRTQVPAKSISQFFSLLARDQIPMLVKRYWFFPCPRQRHGQITIPKELQRCRTTLVIEHVAGKPTDQLDIRQRQKHHSQVGRLAWGKQ